MGQAVRVIDEFLALADVNTSSLVDGELMVWDAASSKVVNKGSSGNRLGTVYTSGLDSQGAVIARGGGSANAISVYDNQNQEALQIRTRSDTDDQNVEIFSSQNLAFVPGLLRSFTASADWNLKQDTTKFRIGRDDNNTLLGNYYSFFEVHGTGRVFVGGTKSTEVTETVDDGTSALQITGNLALRNGITPTEFLLHGTYTDASNYERLRIYGQTGDDFVIASEALGTGVQRDIKIDGNVDIGLNVLVLGHAGHGIRRAGTGNVYESSGSHVLKISGNQLSRFTGSEFRLYGLPIVPDSGPQVIAGNASLRNGLTPTEQHIYSTYTDASNYERLRIYGQTGGPFVIASEALGTGTKRNFIIRSGGSIFFDPSGLGNGFHKCWMGGSAFVPRINGGYGVGNSSLRMDWVYGHEANFDGDINFAGLPVSDPLVVGQLWNDAGTVKISAG